VWTFPVLLDCRPAPLQRKRAGSLLLAPLGDSTVLSHLRSRLRKVTGAAPVIVTRFEIDEAYEEAVRKACPDAETVAALPAFVEQLHTYEPSDQLLFADPACFPLDENDPALGRVAESDDPAVTHLVALEQGGPGTKEYIDSDSSGRIRAIQRYYDSVTWPFAAGVAWSLVPVSCLRVAYELPLASLSRLRRVLSTEGVPSRDVALERGAVNLATHGGLLAMNERVVLALARQSARRQGPHPSLLGGSAAKVDASASIVGPVVLQEGVEIEEGATIIGPSVIGAGSRVGARATVAQCVVGPRLVVAPGASLRHRVFLGNLEAQATAIETDLVEVEGKGETAKYEVEAWEPATPGIVVDLANSSFHGGLKRAMDAGAAAVGLLAGAAPALLIAALIKLESSGPILFGHAREGRWGRPFRCWKFRTMVLGADQQQRKLSRMNEMDGPQFKVGQDPRRTRVGRFLTATNLDEIPQLWNVLVGEMSLVGPRPSPFRENQVCVPWREGRLSVRPGITGLWQICRHDRHKGDFHQWIYYDLLYVRNMSLWLDLKILVLTVLSLAHRGYVPLSWVLPPEKYGERRSAPRPPGPEAAPRPLRSERSTTDPSRSSGDAALRGLEHDLSAVADVDQAGRGSAGQPGRSVSRSCT
jgi:lipopolysaccharide/colanic/teichoic acid biosynthesis glycosyltransferase/carbonic anhydrase/acetyltransferase-like protein (isoleucine patch superfamily)